MIELALSSIIEEGDLQALVDGFKDLPHLQCSHAIGSVQVEVGLTGRFLTVQRQGNIVSIINNLLTNVIIKFNLEMLTN